MYISLTPQIVLLRIYLTRVYLTRIDPRARMITNTGSSARHRLPQQPLPPFSQQSLFQPRSSLRFHDNSSNRAHSRRSFRRSHYALSTFEI
jgi:hypothetical protein